MPIPTAGLRATQKQVDLDALASGSPPEPEVPEVAKPPADLDALAGSKAPIDLDTLADGERPLSMEAQIQRGGEVARPVPTREELSGQLFDVWSETVAAEKRAGRTDGAEDVAWSVVNGLRHVPAGDTRGKNFNELASGVGLPVPGSDPFEAAGMLAQKVTTPGSAANRFAEAVSPKWFSEDTYGVQDTAGWRVAESQAERERAASLRAAEDIRAGIAPDEAKRAARERLNSGAALLLPTASNPDTAMAMADTPMEFAVMPTTLRESAVDLASGALRASTSIANTAKDVMVDIPGYFFEKAQGALGLEDLEKSSRAVREWSFPDPVDALVHYYESIPEEEITDDQRGDLQRLREGSFFTGMAGLRNEIVPDWVDPIDPRDAGFLNTVARVVTSKNTAQMPNVSGEDVVASVTSTVPEAVDKYGQATEKVYEYMKGDATGEDVQTAVASAAAAAGKALKEPLSTGFGALSTTPEGRESTGAWWMRVGGTALASPVTTYLARVSDKTLTSMGAESYRKHRVPWEDQQTGGGYAHALARKMRLGDTGHEVASWAETLLPILDDGSYMQDVATTVWNGDSFMPETMRGLDTLVKGTDWFSPETKASMLPGGNIYEIVTALAMGADLVLPIDGIAPRVFLAEPAMRTHRFVNGYLAGKMLSMPAEEAAKIGVAKSFPSVADRILRSDPEYLAAHERLSGQHDRPAAPGVTVTRTRDTDADSVMSAGMMAWVKKQMDLGNDPIGVLQASEDPAHRVLSDRIAELFTTLAVERTPTEKAPTEPKPPTDEPVVVTKERRAARQNIVTEAESALVVADKEGSRPIAKFNDAVYREADPVARHGAMLGQLAAHWGVSQDTAKAALQAAMSFVDPSTGRPVRSPWLDEDGISQVRERHVALGLTRLRNATPAQVFRNLIRFENGEVVTWTNDVSPARQRAMDTLNAMAREGKAKITVDDVRTYMAVADRMATALVNHGVLPDTEAFWSAKEYTAAEGAKPTIGGWIDFRDDANAIIAIARSGDLSTLFHEDAHLLRRLIPADQMASVDAVAKERFGGWNVKAEEWFAEQMESVIAKGELDVPEKEAKRNPGIYKRLRDALDRAAKVLSTILRGREMEPLHPEVAKWAQEYLFSSERIRRRDVVDTEPVSRRPAPGMTPERLEIVSQAFEDLVSEADGPVRRREIHKLVNDVAYWAGLSKEESRGMHAAVGVDDLAVLADLMEIAQGTKVDMAHYVAKAQEAPKTGKTKAAKGKPAVAAEPVPEVVTPEAPPPVAPTEAVKPPEPAKESGPSKARRAMEDRLSNLVAGVQNANLATSQSRAMAFLRDVARVVLERDGSTENVDDTVTRRVLGDAAVNDYRTAVRQAYRDFKDRTGVTDNARSDAVLTASQRVLAAVGLYDPLAAVADASRVSPVLDILATTVTPEEKAVAREASEHPPLSLSGSASHNQRGMQRILVDASGASVPVVVRRVSIDDVTPSHKLTLAWNEGYDKAFQNRTDAFQRAGWLQEKVARYNPVLAQSVDTMSPTIGAPTVWRAADGTMHITAGNGRTLVMQLLMERAAAGDPAAQIRLQAHQAEVAAWSQALGLGAPGPRDILVFEMDAPYDVAVSFAKNSQGVPAAELSSMETSLSHADQIRQSEAVVPLDVSKLPEELNAETVRSYIEANPTAFDRALAVLWPEPAERRAKMERGGDLLVDAVNGILLGQIDRATHERMMGYGKDVVDMLAACVPMIVQLDRGTENAPDLAIYRLSSYFADAVELWQSAVATGHKSPEALGKYAANRMVQTSLAGGRPLPVSKVSVAMAMAMMQARTPGGVARRARDLVNGLTFAQRPPLFGRTREHHVVALEYLTGDTNNASLIPPEIPDTHGAAQDYARQMEMVGIEARRSEDPALVTEPPGYEELKEATGATDAPKEQAQERLYQDPRYPEAATSAAAAGETLRTAERSTDKGPRFRAAFVSWAGPTFTDVDLRAAAVNAPPDVRAVLSEWEATLLDPKNKGDISRAMNAAMPVIASRNLVDAMVQAATLMGGKVLGDRPTNSYGVMASTIRGKPLLTREQLNLALGYRADQRVYDAVDLNARVAAYAVTSLLQGREMPTRYTRPGNRVAVPVTRVAAVRARALAVLGDMPKRIAASVYHVTEAPSAILPNGRVEPGKAPTNRGIPEVVRLNETDAHRFLALRDWLEDTGWADSLPLSVRRLTLEDVVRGSRYDARTDLTLGSDLTLEMWSQTVGAVMDAQSGTASFRGKAERHSLAASLVWYVAQRVSEFDTTPRDAGIVRKMLAKVRSMTSGFVLDAIANPLLPWEQYAPDMPEHIRPIYEKYARTIGRLPGDLVEALKSAINNMSHVATGRDTLTVAALRDLSATMHGLDAPISVTKGPTGYSDLEILRGWLFADATPDPLVKTSAPYQRVTGGDFVPHDLPRVVDGGGHPITDVVGEVRAHGRVVERVVRRQGILDADTLNAITALRDGTMDAQQATFLLKKVQAALMNAQEVGLDILTAAAGRSGDADTVRQAILHAKKQGIALDAYEAFYTGDWNRQRGVAREGSVEAMVESLQKAAVSTDLWVFEVMNNLRTRWATEQFVNDLIDNQYTADLTTIWKMGHRGTVPDLATRAIFSERVARAMSAILLGQDVGTTSGITAEGTRVGGSANFTGITDVERAVAHALIARMGMRPDLASSRKAMKGRVAGSAVTRTFSDAFYDQGPRGQVTPRTPQEQAFAAAKMSGVDPSMPEMTLAGASPMMYAPLLERMRELQSEQGSLGQYLAGVLKDREGMRRTVEAIQDYARQYKGMLISGGPNGVAAAALTGAALAGGATLPAAALAGAAGLVWSFRPRLAAYATNALGAILQGHNEYGLRWLSRMALDEITKARGVRAGTVAARATMHSITLDRMAGPLDVVSRLIGKVFGGAVARAADEVAFVDANGRVWTDSAIINYGETHGLDGTQAKFESAEKARHAMDRIAREYAPTTPAGQMYNAVAKFFGRHAIAENYRKMYEANDTFFRYLYFTRGLMDGESPHDALKRALNATFDYSTTAPIDRAINSFFLFWMFQRRTVDMVLRSLVTNPHRVLGPLRFLRDQDLKSGYVEENEDHVPVAETVPDYMAGRYAINYLPIAGSPNSAAMKLGLQEALTVNATRIIADVSGVDTMALMGRARPEYQLGFNLMNSSAGNEWVSFFRKGTVQDSSYFDVPLWFVRADQTMFGGSFGKRFGWFVEPVDDPSRYAAPGYPFAFRVPPDKYAAWEIFRNVAGMATIFGNGDIDARAGGWTTIVNENVMDFIAQLDPQNAGGFRSDVGYINRTDGSLVPAALPGPRDYVGRENEGLRNLGVGMGVIKTSTAARDDIRRQVQEAAKARLEQLKRETPPVSPTNTPVDASQMKPAAPLGLQPDKPMGLFK